jgi:hypothetical protein
MVTVCSTYFTTIKLPLAHKMYLRDTYYLQNRFWIFSWKKGWSRKDTVRTVTQAMGWTNGIHISVQAGEFSFLPKLQTGSAAHPVSCYAENWRSFPGRQATSIKLLLASRLRMSKAVFLLPPACLYGYTGTTLPLNFIINWLVLATDTEYLYCEVGKERFKYSCDGLHGSYVILYCLFLSTRKHKLSNTWIRRSKWRNLFAYTKTMKRQ